MASSAVPSSFYINGKLNARGKAYLRDFCAETPYPTGDQYIELSQKTGMSVSVLAVNISSF
jgi:hypothetical protein